MQSKSVIFFGTDEIGSCVLEKLINLKANIIAVVTRADKPSGRNKKIIVGQVKQIALDHNIKVFQPEKLSDVLNELSSLKPDLILTCSYGKIIPIEIINLPKYHCVNIHPSLLPKYRGASPMQGAILNNETETGVTFMFVTKALDEGDILFQEKIQMSNNETLFSLKSKVKNTIESMLEKYYDQLFDLNIKHFPQDNQKASYISIIDANQEKIDWNESAIRIDAKVRALYDKPIAYTVYEGIRIKIFSIEVTNDNVKDNNCGLITEIDKTGISVQTQDKIIKITKIQIPGKNPVEIKQIVNGKHIFKVNTKFS